MLRKIEADERRPSKQLAALLAAQLSLTTADQALLALVARGERSTNRLPLPEHIAAQSERHAHHLQLPRSPTPLIGRAASLTAASELLLRQDVRLLTLTGPPGVGKTRLSLALAAELRTVFTDGVVFIPLAAIRDVALLPLSIAQVLGIQAAPGQPVFATLCATLAGQRLVLVLDNLEQLPDAAPLLADLLAATDELKLLITSRVALRLRSEQRYVVPPLAVPAERHIHRLRVSSSEQHTVDVDALLAFPAIELFVQRARAVQPTFELHAANAASVVALCSRLDGLPLAIELAAARCSVLTPAELLARLDQRLALLSDGASDLPERQRTLRAAIDGSYALLSPDEQHLMRQLGVFAGGSALSAVERVCAESRASASDMLRRLATLVDHSLVQHAGAGEQSRLTMLESIRVFALEQLDAAGELEQARDRHAIVYCELAHVLERGLYSAEQTHVLAQLRAEHDNMRTALEWLVTRGSMADALGLAGDLAWGWMLLGSWSEAQHWLERLLADPDCQAPTPGRLKALLRLEYLVCDCLNTYERVPVLLEACLSLAQQLNDRRSYALALRLQGSFERRRGAYLAGEAPLQQAIVIFGEIDEIWEQAYALLFLGDVYRDQARYSHARACFEQSLSLFARLGDAWSVAWNQIKLGEITRDQGDYVHARPWFEQAALAFTAVGSGIGHCWALTNLAIVELETGATERAAELFAYGLAEFHRHGQQVGVAYGLKGLADVLILRGTELPRATQLLSAADQVLTAIGAGITPGDRVDVDPRLTMVRGALDNAAFDEAWEAGQSVPIVHAVDLALQLAG